jgi:hypothetical protein
MHLKLFIGSLLISMVSISYSYTYLRSQTLHNAKIYVGNSLASQESTAYMGPTPPAGSGKHRVVYALFEHQNTDANAANIEPLMDESNGRRINFDLKKFASDNQLKVVNAAYIYTQYQEGITHKIQEVNQSGFVGEVIDGAGDIFNGVVHGVGGIVDSIIDDLGNNVGGLIGDLIGDILPFPRPIHHQASASAEARIELIPKPEASIANEVYVSVNN